jgi:hypothetical protein
MKSALARLGIRGFKPHLRRAAHPRLMGDFVRMGARYVSTGTDLSFLLSAATTKVKQVREF